MTRSWRLSTACFRSTVAYRMQYCVWGLDKYEKLDKIYSGIVRGITRNLKGYPSKPLWALAVDGGLGLQSLIDYSQRCKLRLLLKNIDRDDTTGKAFESLVSRALRSAGTGGLRWRGQIIRPNLGKPTWMTSLVAWLGKMGIQITVQGPLAPGPYSELVTGDHDRLVSLVDRGIALTGEESNDPSLLPVQVRVGQCWEYGDKVLEITGFNSI